MVVYDLVGKRFGRLTVIEFYKSDGRRRLWKCLCDCGNEKIAKTGDLNFGTVTSCGCRQREAALENCANNYLKPTHGMSKTVEHKCWSSMIERCKPNGSKATKDYGDRGIRVCERWQKFENFFEDMGPRPEGMSLDRIDPDGNYTPENCRWATLIQQQRNRRVTRYFVVDGVRKPVMQVANEVGLNKNQIYHFVYALEILKRVYSNIEIEGKRNGPS